MSEITFYTTGCPMCRVLKKKMDDKGLNYRIVDSIEEMEALGLMSIPALMVDGNLLLQAEAIKWANQQ